MENIKDDLNKMSLFEVETIRVFFQKKYSGLFWMGVLIPIEGIKEKADKYCKILKSCDEVFEQKELKYLSYID